MAPGTVIVISTMGMPPAAIASTANRASLEDRALTTGTIPISLIRLPASPGVILMFLLTSDARTRATHCLFDFFQCDHGGVAGCSHCQCTVCGATLDSPLRILSA